jgi:hypothetical protein
VSANSGHSCAAPVEFLLGIAILCKSLHDKIKSYNLYPNAPQTAPTINSGAKELLKTGL